VKNPTTFVKVVFAFPDSIGMKNGNVKNLDLLYLKIYNSSVDIFLDILCCIMTVSYTKNSTKLCCKSFHMSYFVFMQNLSK
jgi:hypothetical protein